MPTIQEYRAGREAYNRETDNHPTIHSNRFPAWDDLSINEQMRYIEKAKKEAVDGPTIDLMQLSYKSIIDAYTEAYPDLPEEYTANDILADIRRMINQRRALDTMMPTIDYILQLAEQAGYKDSGDLLKDAQNQLMLCRFATKIIEAARDAGND